MSTYGPADDESVVCVTPTEGSVKEEPILITSDDAHKDNAKDDDKESGTDSDKVIDKPTIEVVVPSTRKSTGMPPSPPKEEVTMVKVGMVCDKKNLYQKWDRHQRFTWTETYPEGLEEAAENEQTMKYAILVRNSKSYDSRKKLEVNSIVIQSPLLKEVLHDVLKDYPGVTTQLGRLAFHAPFKPFVHRWAEFKEALESDKYGDEAKAHAKLLYDVLAEELQDVISAVEDYAKNQVVTYEHVWAIFQPGCTVFTTRFGRPVALKLEQGNYAEQDRYGHCFVLKASRIDWDGSKFGFDATQLVVVPFLGTVPITDLDCYPIEFHPDCDAIKSQLMARGRIFEELAGCHFKSYKGQAVETKIWGPSMISVEGRIVVDAFAFHKFWTESNRSLKSLNHVETAPVVHASDGYDNQPHRYYVDEECDNDDMLLDEGKNKIPLTEDQMMLCAPTVKGYALKSKKWADFFIDSIEEVVFDEKAFDRLVLPDGHKEMILAFAQSQVQHKDRFDDDISGKGKGMIMLLSGGPGIGKTLTAESVSEAMKAPLYAMSAGDLGTSSDDVEENLNRVLEVAAKWDAVLLLDECDAFLEARNTNDLDRNRIVSIFLRTLEYYQGIMFLTTNRVKHMDEAFHSRIHVSLEYPPLDRPARLNVWNGFLDRDGHDVTRAQIERLAKLEINGRVIKNVIKTGNLLACHQGKRLGFEHLKTVLKVEGHTVEGRD